MERRSTELWLALVAIIVITLVYLLVMNITGSTPAASGLFGHSLGIIGFILMLMTELLYSLRKRSRKAYWGRTSFWLKSHIFTGLVGPYMVLLHTSWKYNGVASIAMLLTIIVVVSGFVGRYIYTAVPRTADGAELEASEINRQMDNVKEQIQQWVTTNPEIIDVLAKRLAEATADSGSSEQVDLKQLFARMFLRWKYRFEWWQEKRKLQAMGFTHLQELEDLLERGRILRRQVASLAMARQMLAVWHTVHMPIGISLFVVTFIHIGAALYYATLLK